MSIKLMSEVWGKDLDHSQQSILLAMADFADDSGERCYPSIPRLAWKTGYSERQTSTLLKNLLGIGYLRIVTPATNRSSAQYKICIDSIPDKPPYEPKKTRDEISSSQEVGDEISSSLGMKSDASRDEKISSDPLYNHYGNKEKNLQATPAHIHSEISVEEEVSTIVTEKSSSPLVAPPPPTKAGKKKDSDPRTREILAAYVEVRGQNGINYAQEGVFAKKIAEQFGNEDYLSLVKGTYTWLKADSFWQYKPVGMATIFKNIEEFKRWRDKTTVPAKKKEFQRTEPETDPNFVGRMDLPRVGYFSGKTILGEQ